MTFLSSPLCPVHMECGPRESTLFTPQKVRNVIDRVQFGKGQDHDGFPNSWTEHTIVPIFK